VSGHRVIAGLPRPEKAQAGHISRVHKGWSSNRAMQSTHAGLAVWFVCALLLPVDVCCVVLILLIFATVA
jgi:hypothetical protein